MKLLKLGDWLYLIKYKWYKLHGQYGKGGKDREKDEDGQASHNPTLPLLFLTSLSITFNLYVMWGEAQRLEHARQMLYNSTTPPVRPSLACQFECFCGHLHTEYKP